MNKKENKTCTDRRPLISVIVPVYNVEKYLARCVDSILEQTYENLEIILVNDGSTDASGEIIDKYVAQDDRVKKVDHKKNRGLFQARLSGADIAHGEYIAFVDSDDYISIDWYRMLVKKAEETSADIVVGEWCFDNNGESKTYLNLDPFRIKDYELTGDDVLEAFMEQEGRCFSWTILVNKIYKLSIWKQCEKEYHRYSDEHGNMIMWEDIAFSSALWTRAKKVTNVHNINYFYYKHVGASTGINKSRARNEKYIRDSSDAIMFMKSQLMISGDYQRVEEHYLNWRNRAATMLYHEMVLSWGLKYMEEPIRKAFSINCEFIEHSSFFYEKTTKLENTFQWYEELKKRICSPKTKIVSFDIFDTMLSRPFLEPSDLFYILNDIVNANQAAYTDFAQIRKRAEDICREKRRLERPYIEEVTLDEIYDEIQVITGYSSDKVELLKKREIELETHFCKSRRCGKELYDLARFANKRVILCSDMYLPKDVVETILTNCGYSGWETLYLSCDIGKTKHTGNLYKYVLRDLKIRDSECVCHIGDNWSSDVERSKENGIMGQHLCKAADVFRNYNPGTYGGELYEKAYVNNRGKEDYALMLQDYPAARSMLALVANKFFDNPYVSINTWSDFNGNPAYIGYAALGPHLMALAKWVEKRASELGVGTVHFVARDGYMVKRAFDLLNRSRVKSDYIRLSRKSLILGDVNKPEDILSLGKKVSPYHCSVKKLLTYLSPIIPKEKAEKAKTIVESGGFSWDFAFGNEREFYRCLRVFADEIIDFSLLPIYKSKLKKYFSEQIKPGDYIFDIGYSGRPEAALSNILGFSVGSFYIHENSEIAEKRRQPHGCANECFYPYKPKITGLMREHLLMELGPSTIGYQEEGDSLQPVFEKYEKEYCSAFVTTVLQENALAYIKDMISTFGEYLDNMVIPQSIQSAAFEYYLHYSKPFDREMFSTLPFEDNLGEGKVLRALDFWNNEIAVRGVWQDDRAYANSLPEGLRDIYTDGLFIRFYRKMNKLFPKGGRMREAVKKIAAVFIR